MIQESHKKRQICHHGKRTYCRGRVRAGEHEVVNRSGNPIGAAEFEAERLN